MPDLQQRICVIGAGPSGITAVKNLVDRGFTNVVVYDRGERAGGNWVFSPQSGHSSVFETTHIISSKRYSAYGDFPMPASVPDYPGHTHLAAYFQAYVRHFELERFIEFRTLVHRCERLADGRWSVTVERDGVKSTLQFDQLVVCNGHHWKPRMPEYPGTFSGTFLHSHDFKRAAPFEGRRVLVVGGGNSACDVAVETSRVSARTDISWRRGYWIVPKFVFGIPGDHVHNALSTALPLPRALRTWINETMLRLLNGRNALYGLPEPDHRFGETHPTLNSELLYFIRHGQIHPRPDISRFDGQTVHFVGGTQADYDAVIACTGYIISHPFFDTSLIDYSQGQVPLYLKMIHPTFENLHFIGLFQPLGCIWPAAELQAKIMARRLAGEWKPPAALEEAIRNELAHPDLQQLDTPRHTITVDYPFFRRRLLKELPSNWVSTEPSTMRRA